jgi:hypothetical protein
MQVLLIRYAIFEELEAPADISEQADAAMVIHILLRCIRATLEKQKTSSFSHLRFFYCRMS